MGKSIFISYKNDGEGNNFAARLCDDIEKMGYSVYFNSHEKSAGAFPERLRKSVEECEDFILILSKGCLNQLMKHQPIDWIREELLCAKKNEKNIIPIVIGQAQIPCRKEDLPESIAFLIDLEMVPLPEQYTTAPINLLLALLKSKPESDKYRFVANGNELYDVHEDFCSIYEKAENGDLGAMYELACMYYYGLASKKDGEADINQVEASKWLKRIVEYGRREGEITDCIISANVMLANLYYSGNVCQEEQSFKKCFDILWDIQNKCMEDENDFFSQDFERNVFMMTQGMGSQFEFSKLVNYFEEHHQEEYSTNTKSCIAKFYMDYGMYDKAVTIMESIADHHPEVEYRLGMLYLRGVHNNPPKPDVYRAEHYLTSAAEMGHVDALHALGLLNFRGQYGYRQNTNRARNYLRLAAEKGHKGAQYDYAWLCRYGIGGERDIAEAVKYHEKAALQGHVLSMTELALLYQEEECRDYHKAFTWAELSAATGNRQGEFILANLYMLGRGCEADMDKAMCYYKKSYEKGMYQAKMMMDKCKEKMM